MDLPVLVKVLLNILKRITLGIQHVNDLQEGNHSYQHQLLRCRLNSMVINNNPSIANSNSLNTSQSLTLAVQNSATNVNTIFINKSNSYLNEKVYYQSMSSLLCLRLLCPAIISPVEYGTLKYCSKPKELSLKERLLQNPGNRINSVSRTLHGPNISSSYNSSTVFISLISLILNNNNNKRDNETNNKSLVDFCDSRDKQSVVFMNKIQDIEAKLSDLSKDINEDEVMRLPLYYHLLSLFPHCLWF